MPVHTEPTRLLVVRHGETDWNVQTRIQGYTDIPLNARGEAQARHLATRIAELQDLEPVRAVYASDLMRAWTTADALAQACGLTVRTDLDLRERQFGHFEGLTFAQIETDHPEDARRWRERDPAWAPRGGELSLIHISEPTRH